MKTCHIHITGVVQGVGFRPFVYGLAIRNNIHGWVCNTSAGVDIEAQAVDEKVDEFILALRSQKPGLAHIDSITVSEIPTQDLHEKFVIRESESIPGAFQPISPDVSICDDCLHEMFDPQDRRYLYPFINCTNCGPRFTIIKDLPYDRPATTMAGFPLCGNCLTEYKDPSDRRFHAQPIACPTCGPSVWLESRETSDRTENLDAILTARRILREGGILAVKGLGGFHLACDAGNEQAVAVLRERKGRQGKPFALMAADLPTIESLCRVCGIERELLSGREKPIVLLDRLPGFRLAEQVAPGVDMLGMMLPYTPLHHLLLSQSDPCLGKEPVPAVLVMTSGNLSEEPIVTSNTDARERLSALADAFLMHNREIHIRCDDSVVRSWGDQKITHLRRSRGYAPYPVLLPSETRPTLAVGGELKNTFCLTREKYAFLSHHIGDMENVETCSSFEQGIDHLSRLFRIKPEILACDLHPGYFSTNWAQHSSLGFPPIQIQHHHAHIAACMADHQLTNRRVIGLAYDGTGYGTDGSIWGGEILLADYSSFERAAHLEYLPLSGGDVAIRNPWRIAVGYTHALGLDISDLSFLSGIDPQAVHVVKKQVERNLNTVPTSSMGRLFDAVAVLAGIRNTVTYEAQAAIELEVRSRTYLAQAEPYPFEFQDHLILLKDLLSAVIDSVRRNEPAGHIGARFHRTIVSISLATARNIQESTGIREVALSGGVWQNKLLLQLAIAELEKSGFVVYFHRHTPTNDGGIALGQAVVANHT